MLLNIIVYKVIAAARFQLHQLL